MTKPTPERRRFTRIHFNTPCILRHHHTEWDVQLVDICFKGALTQQPDEACELTVGDEANLILELNTEDVIINMPVVLNHKINGLFGFKLQQIDISSMTHLRRLVELNLGSPELLERELEHLYHHTTLTD